MALKYQIVPVTPLEQNCTLLWCDETMRAAVADPGGDIPRILAAIGKFGLDVERILVTHGHVDHAGGVAELAERLSVPVEGPHEEDRFWIDCMPQQPQMFGLPRFSLPDARVFVPDRWLKEGDGVHFGRVEMRVLHCPGHTPGHVVFFSDTDRLAVVGDVLFRGSVGRADFPKGDFATLMASIRQKLWPLGDDVTFISGHGPMSTFGEERLNNPLCGGWS
jgi:glyoxylase-like metal-dependent hydrolase (beta-lactamase superfamily II)